MTSKWIYEYNSDIIVVAGGQRAEKALFVNGELQDKKQTMAFTELNGRTSGDEEIKVRIGGLFVKTCKLYVNDKFLTPVKTENKKASEWTYKRNEDTITVINNILSAEI